MNGAGAAGGSADGLSGWRWKATLGMLAFAALLDLAFIAEGGGPWWSPLQLLLLLLVSAVAVVGLRCGGPRLLAAARLAAPLSLAASAGLGAYAVTADAYLDLGFVEGTALTLLLVACWRRAAGRRQQAVAGAVALAVVLLPARLGLGVDTVTVEALAITVAALAVATGSVLRATDASHQAAVTTVAAPSARRSPASCTTSSPTT